MSTTHKRPREKKQLEDLSKVGNRHTRPTSSKADKAYRMGTTCAKGLSQSSQVPRMALEEQGKHQAET